MLSGASVPWLSSCSSHQSQVEGRCHLPWNSTKCSMLTPKFLNDLKPAHATSCRSIVNQPIDLVRLRSCRQGPQWDEYRCTKGVKLFRIVLTTCRLRVPRQCLANRLCAFRSGKFAPASWSAVKIVHCSFFTAGRFLAPSLCTPASLL